MVAACLLVVYCSRQSSAASDESEGSRRAGYAMEA